MTMTGTAARLLAWSVGMLVVAAILQAQSLGTGVAIPINPTDYMDFIVVATVARWEVERLAASEHHTVTLNVEETLKGSWHRKQLRAYWVSQLPPGCDTDPCGDAAGWSGPPRPVVGERMIVSIKRQVPEGFLLAFQQYTYPFSEPKRRELLKRPTQP